ncbi:MAG: hypothetical protein ACRD1C_09735 [Terriglobales bacterium]
MVDGSLTLSIITLALAFSVLAYSIFSLAHVKVTDADMTELDRLHREAVLPERVRLVEDFQFIHAKVAHIAPAVYLRQEFWLQSYFQLVRFARWVHPSSGLDHELLKLNAFQARHYWVAMQRLDALQNPSL